MNSFASPQTLTALPFSRRHEAADDLYSRVFDAILEQRIHAASRFTEESLAQMFGARRSDIRGVLTQLSHQQIIVLRANHRPRVAAPDAEQTRQTLHARRLTEITLVQLACQQPCKRRLETPARVDRARTPVPGARPAWPGDSVVGGVSPALADMAGNAPLAHFLGSLVPLTSLAIAQFDAQAEDYCAWQVHEGIVDAVERGDAVMAGTLTEPASGSS